MSRPCAPLYTTLAELELVSPSNTTEYTIQCMIQDVHQVKNMWFLTVTDRSNHKTLQLVMDTSKCALVKKTWSDAEFLELEQKQDDNNNKEKNKPELVKALYRGNMILCQCQVVQIDRITKRGTISPRDYVVASDVQVYPTAHDEASATKAHATLARDVPLSALSGKNQHLKPFADLQVALYHVQNGITRSLMEYAWDQGFLQVFPNQLTMSNCEGGGDVFGVHTFYSDKHEREYRARVAADKRLPLHKQTWRDWPVIKEGEPNLTNSHFAGHPMFLTVSSELPLHPACLAAPGVFCLQKSFRAEESDTSRHLSEFLHFEGESKRFCRLPFMMDYCEGSLKRTMSDATTKHAVWLQQIEQLDKGNPRVKGLFSANKRWATIPWGRIGIDEAIEIWQRDDAKIRQLYPELNKRDADGKLLVPTPTKGTDPHACYEKYICTDYVDPTDIKESRLRVRIQGNVPVFIWGYRASMKAFYMYQAEDGSALCMDLQLPGIGEGIGGSARETRLKRLMESMVSRGMHVKDEALQSMSWLLDLYAHSSVPHGGFGLGVERLMALITGQPRVHDMCMAPIAYRVADDYGPRASEWRSRFEAVEKEMRASGKLPAVGESTVETKTGAKTESKTGTKTETDPEPKYSKEELDALTDQDAVRLAINLELINKDGYNPIETVRMILGNYFARV